MLQVPLIAAGFSIHTWTSEPSCMFAAHSQPGATILPENHLLGAACGRDRANRAHLWWLDTLAYSVYSDRQVQLCARLVDAQDELCGQQTNRVLDALHVEEYRVACRAPPFTPSTKLLGMTSAWPSIAKP